MLPAVLFVLFVSLLALMPANVGDRPEQYSFAMSYNRYGWSAYSILALILFVAPRGRLGERKHRGWIDVAVAGGLLAAMFYLKITYFAVGLATVGFALLVQHPSHSVVNQRSDPGESGPVLGQVQRASRFPRARRTIE